MHDGAAEIDVRGKRMRASVRDLRVIGGAAQARPASGQRARASCSRARRVDERTLNVIGNTVDEAIDRAERFLDEIAADRISERLRLIHGYGTGQLKRALSSTICTSTRWSPASARRRPKQGGGGVTVVELKD